MTKQSIPEHPCTVINKQPSNLYLECVCHDLDDIMRVSFYDTSFSFEYRLGKFPTSWHKTWKYTFYPKKPFKNAITLLLLWKDKTLNYLKSILWAISGRPHWFEANIELDAEEAKKLYSFIWDNLNKK